MRLKPLSVALLPVLALTVSCQNTQYYELWQLEPGSTVYVDAWDEDGDVGDRAQLEQKPSGAWVLPRNAQFDRRHGGRFDVEVTLDPKRGFVVTNLHRTRVGKDHDDCLEGEEHYVAMDVPATSLSWEPADREADTSNDDCVAYGSDY